MIARCAGGGHQSAADNAHITGGHGLHASGSRACWDWSEHIGSASYGAVQK